MSRAASFPSSKVEKWLLRIRAGKPLAVLLGSTINGLSFVRSLDRRDVPALQLDSDKNEAMHTRYGASHLLPPLGQSASEWLRFLEFVGSRLEEPGVIFPTSDAHLLFLSRNRQEIGRFFRFMIPGPEAVEQIINKRTQYTIAEKAGIAIPKTLYPESMADVRSCAEDIPYPCILKPYTYEGRGTIGENVILVHSPSQLIVEYGRVSESGQGFMIQEVIPGDASASFAYNGFWDSDGKEIAWWTRQHLRRHPFGNGSILVTVAVPEVAALSRRLLSAFDYRGFSNVQIKLDVRDKNYRLMEINARTGQANQIGIAAGVDFPWIGYCYLSGASTGDKLSSPFKPGVMYMDEKVDLELWWSGEIRFVSWFRSFMKAHAKAYWAWHDPGPFLALVWSLGSSYLRRRLVGFVSDLPMMAGILSKLASLYRFRKNYAQAERLSKLALQVGKKRFGNQDPRVANMLHNLANLYRDQQRYTEAEPLYQESLAIMGKVLGTAHPKVTRRLLDLVAFYQAQGRDKEAASLRERLKSKGENRS